MLAQFYSRLFAWEENQLIRVYSISSQLTKEGCEVTMVFQRVAPFAAHKTPPPTWARRSRYALLFCQFRLSRPPPITSRFNCIFPECWDPSCLQSSAEATAWGEGPELGLARPSHFPVDSGTNLNSHTP